MKIHGLLCALTVSLAAAASAFAQTSPDYSREPFVIEQLTKRVEFQDKGTATSVQTARIQIRSEAGVRALGELAFGYNAANERIDIAYLQVRKADGQVLLVNSSAVQELSTPVARMAPVYSDYRQKVVTVPGLRPGDTVEYSVITMVQTPLAPGQFWLSHSFVRNAIVLDEQLEVSVPRGREIKLKTSPGANSTVTDKVDRRVYRWTSSHRIREEESQANNKAKQKPAESPDVQLTTFANWEEVGQWYAGLERDRRVPTPEIRAKAVELVRGRKTDTEKLEAIYDYVAKSFRYVSLSFGVGRYQPHAAREVLANQYGDCKDKAVLLAALAETVGLHASTVLISPTRKLDPDIPSPAQFDHVISLVPVGNNDVWLDTTPEIAPFRLLAPSLREKQALVIPPSGPAKLLVTPAELPFPPRYIIDVEGSVNSWGKLTIRVSQILRGDGELVVRSAFRRTPETQWKNLLQASASSDYGSSEIGDLKVGDVTATREPFRLTYQITRPNYVDAFKRTYAVLLPLPKLPLSDVDEGTKDPIAFGLQGELSEHLKLELPESLQVHLPVPVAVTRDYGEYRSVYRLEGHTLIAERTLLLRGRELPATRAGDYLAFRRTVISDVEQKVSLEMPSSEALTAAANLSSKELVEAGMAALNGGNYKIAVELLQRVVGMEPKHASAWGSLGNAHAGLHQQADAIGAYRRQIEVNPYDAYAYNNLGLALWQEGKYEEALAAFRKQTEVTPLDRRSHNNLGNLYLELHRYAEAVPALEKTASLDPNDPNVQARLGEAYLNQNQDEKALAAFSRAASLGPNVGVWNNIAFGLSTRPAHLDRAQQYAESAVNAAAATSRNLSIETLRPPDLAMVNLLTSCWDTLGWILYQRGETGRAEHLIRAAWIVSQHGQIGDHLGQIYEKRGQKEQAIQTYAQALAAIRPNPETRARLSGLVGADQVDLLVQRARNQLVANRNIKVPEPFKADGKADFLFLVASNKPHAVKFVSGDEQLRAAVAGLRTAELGFELPDGSAKVVRRGTLSCTASSGCTLLLQIPEDVTSVD